MDEVTRRSFLRNLRNTTGFIALSSILPAAWVKNSQLGLDSASVSVNDESGAEEGPGMVGGCAQTLFTSLNYKYGYPLKDEERAADLLSGGMMYQGQQCGMAWGSALAIGAESYRRNDNPGQAMSATVRVTQGAMESLKNTAGSIRCRDITNCDFTKPFSMVKYFVTGKAFSCFNLIGAWPAEAFKAANEGFSQEDSDLAQRPLNCASEVVRKLGASDAEMVMVSGFAGGIGLSGNGCGAVAAAIWMKTLSSIRKQDEEAKMDKNPARKTLKEFYASTGDEMECSKICGRRFNTLNEHSEFIAGGGCAGLIDVLAR